MENIEVYRFSNKVYFIDNDSEIEGVVVLGYGNHGGEVYPYVSHVEIDDYKGATPDMWDEFYETYFEDRLDIILNANEL